MIKKILTVSGIAIFCLHFGQLSKVKELNKIYQKQNEQISAKYKLTYPLERIREEDENNTQRLDGYEEAIKNIQKKELPYNSSSVLPDATKEAEFESGINGFRTLIANNFDTSAISNTQEGTVKTMVSFLIDEKGKVSQVKAEGTSREFNLLTIITLYDVAEKGNWKPADHNGIAIKSVFTLPVVMQFE